MMVNKKLKPDQDLDGDDLDGESSGKKSKKDQKSTKSLKISDMDDWADSDDEMDSDAEGDKGRDDDSKKNKAKSKDAKQKKKKSKEDGLFTLINIPKRGTSCFHWIMFTGQMMFTQKHNVCRLLCSSVHNVCPLCRLAGTFVPVPL